MAIPTEITLADLTTEDKVTGTGVFDVMMRAVKEHVVGEYTKGRITGGDYATVYLGALESTLSTSMTFLLEKDKRSFELEMLAIQKEKLQAEKLLVDAQVLLAQAQTAMVQAQALNVPLEGLVLTAQKCKLEAEFDLTVATIPKVTAESELLNQKMVTEIAQTNSVFTDVNSVIGKQARLYGIQGDGFLRDAEQKAAELMIGTWNTRRMTDDATPGDDAKLTDADISAVITKLFAGIGVA